MKKLSREELAFYINKSTNGDDSANTLANAPEEKNGSFVVPKTV